MAVKIPVNLLISDFKRMAEEHWPYVWGSAREKCVDCSGAFVYSYKLHGKSIYHGSNRIARRYVEELIPYEKAKREGLIVPGMAAFKARKPGDKKYDLPSQYKKGGEYYNGDLNDYYHIGLVDEDINYVLNAQSSTTGFKVSPITQNWTHVALLKDVDYGNNSNSNNNDIDNGGSIPMTEKSAIVTAPSGSTVNLRAKTDTKSALVERVPVGSRITVLNDLGDWCYVKFKDKKGYMVSNYIEYEGSPIDENSSDEIVVNKNQLIDMYNTLNKLLAEIYGLIDAKG